MELMGKTRFSSDFLDAAVLWRRQSMTAAKAGGLPRKVSDPISEEISFLTRISA